MMMTVVIMNDEIISALSVAESPAEGNPLCQSTKSIKTTITDREIVMIQARNPCEYCDSGGSWRELMNEAMAAVQDAANVACA